MIHSKHDQTPLSEQNPLEICSEDILLCNAADYVTHKMTLANPQILFIWLPHVWATSDSSDYSTITRD